MLNSSRLGDFTIFLFLDERCEYIIELYSYVIFDRDWPSRNQTRQWEILYKWKLSWEKKTLFLKWWNFHKTPHKIDQWFSHIFPFNPSKYRWFSQKASIYGWLSIALLGPRRPLPQSRSALRSVQGQVMVGHQRAPCSGRPKTWAKSGQITPITLGFMVDKLLSYRNTIDYRS